MRQADECLRCPTKWKSLLSAVHRRSISRVENRPAAGLQETEAQARTSRRVILGDIVLIEEGDTIPADAVRKIVLDI